MNTDLHAALVLAWKTGRGYQANVALEDLDDFLHTAPPPRLSYEQRVQQRIAEMETSAEKIARQIEAELAGAPRRPWGAPL